MIGAPIGTNGTSGASNGHYNAKSSRGQSVEMANMQHQMGYSSAHFDHTREGGDYAGALDDQGEGGRYNHMFMNREKIERFSALNKGIAASLEQDKKD